MKVWLNGGLVEERDALVPALDRGLLYGDGLFETLRAYAGKPFLLEEHLDRLAGAADATAMPLPPRKALERSVREVVAANGLEQGDARVRITVTRGLAGEDLAAPASGFPTALVAAQPVRLPVDLYERGVSAVVSTVRVLSGGAAMKSTSFQPHVLAKLEARRAGAWEALLPNELGELAEGATSNLFAVQGGQLVTPPPDAGLLPGLTRAVVLRLAPSLGLRAVERPLSLSVLRAAEEAFLTGSVAEVVPLVAIDGRPLGAGGPGPVTGRVLAAYRDLVAASLRAPQAVGNGKSKRSDSPK